MTLRIAKNAGLTDIVSENNTNPITTDHIATGEAQSVRLFLFNDAAAKRYEDIVIDPVDLTDTDESAWAQLAPDVAGAPGAYLAGSAPLSMANISDANVGYAFWLRVTTLDVGDSMNKEDILLEVRAKEYAV